MEKLGKWADEWLVSINKKKTEATIFSLSPKKETVNLTINGETIPQQETPTYLGVKLDKKTYLGTPYCQYGIKSYKENGNNEKAIWNKMGSKFQNSEAGLFRNSATSVSV